MTHPAESDADPFTLGNVIRDALPDEMRLHGLAVNIARAVVAAGYRRVIPPVGPAPCDMCSECQRGQTCTARDA